MMQMQKTTTKKQPNTHTHASNAGLSPHLNQCVYPTLPYWKIEKNSQLNLLGLCAVTTTPLMNQMVHFTPSSMQALKQKLNSMPETFPACSTLSALFKHPMEGKK